jgi:uracil-DNA glycosylase
LAKIKDPICECFGTGERRLIDEMKIRSNVSRKSGARTRLIALNGRLRACRKCHLAGFLEERESVPIARDPEPDAPLPGILLIGQAPGMRATMEDRPFAGIAGEKLRDWLEQAGIQRDEFYHHVHFAAITRCYPGRLPGAKGDRVPSPQEQALCRPWLDDLFQVIKPKVVLLVGLLAIRTFLGPVASLTAVVGTSKVRDGILFIPLPHPSGVSRWLNEPANLAAVDKAMEILRSQVKNQIDRGS